VVYKPSL